MTIAGAAPVPTISQVYITSITVQWPDVANNTGYVMEAYDDLGYTNLVTSSATANGNAVTLTVNATSLAANTTYWIKVGALYNGATSYAFTTPASTSTLTSFITAQFYRTYVTSVTVNWLPLGSADGYRLDAYNDAAYTSLAGSSVTA